MELSYLRMGGIKSEHRGEIYRVDEEVLKTIGKIKTRKFAGLDEIEIEFLKKGRRGHVFMARKIFNVGLNNGEEKR